MGRRCRHFNVVQRHHKISSSNEIGDRHGGPTILLGRIFEPFIQCSPLSIMSRALLERALALESLDALFGQHAEHSTPESCCSPQLSN